jgi:hypothetical protein
VKGARFQLVEFLLPNLGDSRFFCAGHVTLAIVPESG